MGQVDGMSSGDRGGMQELIALIRRTKMPVVCICNDRGCQKVGRDPDSPEPQPQPQPEPQP